MNCPSCAVPMNAMTMEAHMSAPVEIDVCTQCQSFWFDRYEDMKLSTGSAMRLINLINENSASARKPHVDGIRCPLCESALALTHDIMADTKFMYWRCPNDHGRFMGFLDFLREKKFIRTLSAQEIKELRDKIQTVNCSNCGAAIDLVNDSVCPHCGSPISILDMKSHFGSGGGVPANND